MLEAAKTAHEATLRYIRTPIGKLATRLHSYFALIGDSSAVSLVNAAQRAYAMPLVAARADLASLPMLSAARHSNAETEADPMPIPTSPQARSRSRTWRTSTRTPTV